MRMLRFSILLGAALMCHSAFAKNTYEVQCIKEEGLCFNVPKETYIKAYGQSPDYKYYGIYTKDSNEILVSFHVSQKDSFVACDTCVIKTVSKDRSVAVDENGNVVAARVYVPIDGFIFYLHAIRSAPIGRNTAININDFLRSKLKPLNYKPG